MSNQTSAARADAVFDALGEPVRRQIIARLGGGPTPVGRLADQLTVGRPAVSKHLRVLEGAGLVQHESRGTRNLYALAPEGMAVAQQWLVGMWDAALTSYAEEVRAVVEQREEPHEEHHAPAEPSSRPRTWAEKQAGRQARKNTTGGAP
jgi:DNA-binding transcriptional ArsR family regulator